MADFLSPKCKKSPMRQVPLLFALITCVGAAAPAVAVDFNEYVKEAVTYLSTNYRHGGYDINTAFTHPIPYAAGQILPTSPKVPPAPSMCVAGVAEVILTAINFYVEKTRDLTPYTKAPLLLWTQGNVLSLRANLFMYRGTDSHGTGDTLKRFGMGKELGFDALKPYDFINFNRTTGSGHAVVFLGYVDALGEDLPSATDAKGFKYFSLQGKGKPDAGFGYRWAFFEGSCPTLSGGRIRDCHVVRSGDSLLFNAGRLNAPSDWSVDEARKVLRERKRRAISGRDATLTPGEVDQILEKELPHVIDAAFDGISED